MPVYEYRCPECGEVYELRRSVAERDDPHWCMGAGTHPSGEPAACERLTSRATGFALKGGGWYRDGYHGRGSSSPGEG